MHSDYTPERLQMALAPRPVRYLPSVASTNTAAAEWLAAGAEAGSVVVAGEQTAGRGRHGRTWHTPPGVALALTVIVQPPRPADIAGVNMAGTLAVYHTLTNLNLNGLRIKWANDVLVGDKKISGVLPEPIWAGDTLQGVLLGIGVNVRNDFTGTALDGLATSAQAEANRQIDRVSLLAVLLFQLDSWLDKLGTPAITTAYKRHMAAMLGQPITVHGWQDDHILQGVALDVEPDGALVIRSDDGELKRVYAGDVTVKQRGT